MSRLSYREQVKREAPPSETRLEALVRAYELEDGHLAAKIASEMRFHLGLSYLRILALAEQMGCDRAELDALIREGEEASS